MKAIRRRPLHRIVNLVPSERRIPAAADERVLDSLFDDPESLLRLEGSFALLARRGTAVRMARSLDRPVRFFLAKEDNGPYLVVAERIDEIHACLEDAGHGWQFHPTYSRMVPAHHVTEIQLVGCPDPSPAHERFFDPPKDVLPTDRTEIGRRYIGALYAEVRRWLETVPREEPIGVLFSGGCDSGAVLLCAYRALLASGHSAARLKAFTLAVDGGGTDLSQAREFLDRTSLAYLAETLEVDGGSIDPLRAVEVIEDYKPLDVECAAVNLAALGEIRRRYPSWRFLLDGDGGDENLKDYPIEENRELTIRSVVSNLMLYHEGWGVRALKNSLTYSGGLSRSYVRTLAPQRCYGFDGFSPFTRPAVVAVAEGIPFEELTGGEVEALYRLKGEVIAAGVREVLDMEMPVFPKRRFQAGATSSAAFETRFSLPPETYRAHYLSLYDPRAPTP